MSVVSIATGVESMEKQQEQLTTKALTLPEEAKGIVVTDQATLETAGKMLTERIKPLLKEADDVFDPIVKSAHKAHVDALAGKRKVTDPLLEAERILKTSIGAYWTEQERIRKAEEDRLRREQQEREAEELRQAELRRQEEEARINAEIQQQHAEEIERQLESLPVDTDASLIEEICNTPAPEPVRVAPEMPVFAPSQTVVRAAAPRGVGLGEDWCAEVTSLQLLCKAIGEGKVPEHYVQANMTALNQMARANRQSLNIPGVRAVSKPRVSARSSR